MVISGCRYIIHFSVSLFLCLLSPVIFSQTPRGVGVSLKENIIQGKTRALIVGISKYEYIDSLEFADRDAQMFADYLLQNNFWHIAKEDITLLLNDKAKYGDLTVQLQRIAMMSRPGDNLLFYFSGHGDVETKTLFNRGYLLAYDTYSSNYMANGLRVDDLKDIIVTLLTNDVKVILITDACRSGNLAGGIKGAEFTASAISSMWKNEVKILSSQPGQLSQEGSKWGNGQGVFSYYLIKGLNGEADANKDSAVTLAELDMYVGSNVARETNNKQQPIFEGPNKYSTVLANLKATAARPLQKTGGNSIKYPSHFRIPEDSCTYYFKQMNTAIEEKRFDSKTTPSATTFYQRLKTCTKDTELILQANSQLLAALMNSTQEIINNSFIGKNLVSEEKFEQGINLINQVLLNNDLKLPYDKHLTNLKRYLQVQGTTLWGSESSLPALEPVLDSALKQEPDAAYLLSAKGILELRKMNYTKAIQILEKATENSPGWLIPKYYLGIGYGHKKNYRKALDYYNEILRKDTLYRTFECVKCILEKMAEYEKRLKQIRYDKYKDDINGRASLDSARSLLSDNIDSAYFYSTMGQRFDKKNHPYQDSVYYFYTQAVVLDPSEPEYMYALLRYLRKKSYGEAEIREWLKKTDEYDDDYKHWFQEELLYSYLYSKEIENAFKVAAGMFEYGFYDCSKMKKLANKFGKLPEYQAFIKENCSD